jgi:hypothetical protein
MVDREPGRHLGIAGTACLSSTTIGDVQCTYSRIIDQYHVDNTTIGSQRSKKGTLLTSSYRKEPRLTTMLDVSPLSISRLNYEHPIEVSAHIS